MKSPIQTVTRRLPQLQKALSSSTQDVLHLENCIKSGSSSSTRTTLFEDDVRDGKLFHIRVTVGYLTSLRTGFLSKEAEQQQQQNQQEQRIASPSADVVSVYVSFNTHDEYDFATSLPLLVDRPKQTAKWPKAGSDVKTSKRRLYHSFLLRATDPQVFSNQTHSIPLHVGVQRGDKAFLLGTALLSLHSKEAKALKLDLPVAPKPILPTKIAKQTTTSSPETDLRTDTSSPTSTARPTLAKKLRKSSLKNLFRRNKKNLSRPPPSPPPEAPPEAAPQKQQQPPQFEIFPNHDRIYALDKSSFLRIKLDVREGVYEQNGPGLWGDLEDDEESFGPLPVIDIPDDGKGDLSHKYHHESIEVMNVLEGTTIISSPGAGEAEEDEEEVADIFAFEPNIPTFLPQQDGSRVEESLSEQRDQYDSYEEQREHHDSLTSLMVDSNLFCTRGSSYDTAVRSYRGTRYYSRSSRYDDEDDYDDETTRSSYDPNIPSFIFSGGVCGSGGDQHSQLSASMCDTFDFYHSSDEDSDSEEDDSQEDQSSGLLDQVRLAPSRSLDHQASTTSDKSDTGSNIEGILRPSEESRSDDDDSSSTSDSHSLNRFEFLPTSSRPSSRQSSTAV